MNKFLIMLLLVSSTAGQAQVTLEKGKLVREGQSYSFSDYRIVFQNEEARRLLKKARGHGTTGTILGGIGGGLIGAGLASAITKREKVYYVNNIKYTEKHKKWSGMEPSGNRRRNCRNWYSLRYLIKQKCKKST